MDAEQIYNKHFGEGAFKLLSIKDKMRTINMIGDAKIQGVKLMSEELKKDKI